MESLSMILNSRSSSTEEEEEDHDEGPFIDLEFSIPDEDSEDSENSTLSLSPSNNLFSLEYTSHSKPHPFPSSLLKSKFRIFALAGSKKPKPTSIHPSSPKPKSQNTTPANYFIRFKVEQVPLVSLFTRENNEKIKSSKEVVNKYFNKIKKLRFSSGQVASVVAVEKNGRKDGEKWQGGGSSSPLRLETVRRRLGKSRSASSAVAAVRSPPRRRDDSLLQQQDGIQSAIAHCKRSFHAEKGSELQLVRSNSDPGEINQLKFN
ncbi:probable membrane-associated kinase regulator 5 [Dioscorea cayenensis subsp. rotundata]|uniref:Probable membrane-associated kinase regulator 5 n=1 Tax=Dioscorea cayennensis subsp. rotundata TaxID=55577 RepID=A0AB40B2K9_DIOCR|nr:probable membrane-associated kinase regulator 5 [Dioscorea cayenensis subsp. rotundata]